MGQAVLSGLLRAGWDLGSLVAVESHEETARAVRDRLGIRVVAAPDAIVDRDVVVVAVKPQHVTGALDAATPHLGQDTLVVSLAAGLPITTLEAASSTLAEPTMFTRMVLTVLLTTVSIPAIAAQCTTRSAPAMAFARLS